MSFALPPGFERIPDVPIESVFATAAAAVGRAAAQIDTIGAGYFIGSMYAAMLPAATRAQLGIYYTPPALVTRLLDQATDAGVDWATVRALDPACGGGAFLAPIALRMLKHLSHLDAGRVIEEFSRRLRGFEIDPFAAWMSQIFLEAAVMPFCKAARRRLPILVEVRDSLAVEPNSDLYDLVAGNPPYRRITLPADLRKQYGRSLYGHANLYGVFTDIALRWARRGGVVSYVTPTSFLAGEYFTRLRELLAREAPPVVIDFVTRRKGVFDGVLQEAVLATYRRGGLVAPVRVHFMTPIDEMATEITPVGSFSLVADGRPWLLPRTVDQESLVGRLGSFSYRLADWGYKVSTGPLVWNRHKRQLRHGPGPGHFPLVWAEAVTPDGRFIFRATKSNHRPYFQPQSDQEWLVIREPCVLLQRTTAKEQSRRLIAAHLPERFLQTHRGVVIENHLNMLRPVGNDGVVSPSVVTAFLNSNVVDQAFRCINGSVAVSAYELEALPLPAPERLGELVSAVDRQAGRDVIEAVCMRLYQES